MIKIIGAPPNYFEWSEEKYLSSRLDEQQDYYSKKSSDFQKKYKRCRLIQILISASIPVTTILPYSNQSIINILIVLFGTIITAIDSYLGLQQYHDLWIKYRTTSELLKREKIFFLTRSNIYRDENIRFRLLVDRIESILATENNQWESIIRSCNQQEHKSINLPS